MYVLKLYVEYITHMINVFFWYINYEYVCLYLYEDFWKMIFWLVLKLEISYKIIISSRIWFSFRGFFWRLYFCMVKYLSFHNSSFYLKILLNVNGKPIVWHTPCFLFGCQPFELKCQLVVAKIQIKNNLVPMKCLPHNIEHSQLIIIIWWGGMFLEPLEIEDVTYQP
jgi:hypothetical protein